VGHEGHDEAVGTVAEAPEAIALIEPEAGLGGFVASDPDRVALLAQTTLGLHEWNQVLEQAEKRYPQLHTPRKSDLCYATTNRQEAVARMAETCDLILVVGSEGSSNTQALVRVAREFGRPAFRIEAATDIADEWLQGVEVVGLTAGASAPDHLVQEVIERLAPTAGFDLLSVTEEEEYFPLPPQLRAFVTLLQALVEAGVTARSPGAEGWLEQDRRWNATQALAAIGGSGQ
jgi:4-hydroxy-3-methylbut-2-en-1-yl diphosphate reductase